MREATLNGLSASDALQPRKARLAPGPARSKPRQRSVLAGFVRLRSRATLLIASAGFSAIMAGILCNALLFQKGHHPSPLFAAAPGEAQPPAARLPDRVETAAPPPPAPALVTPPAAPDAQDAVAAPVAPTPHRSVPHAPAPPHRVAAQPGKPAADGIARLLGVAAHKPGAPVKPAAVAKDAHASAKSVARTVDPAPTGTSAVASPSKPKPRPGQTVASAHPGPATSVKKTSTTPGTATN